jgi:tripartite-type tricarboxylate transporter receptor subunit TctC
MTLGTIDGRGIAPQDCSMTPVRLLFPAIALVLAGAVVAQPIKLVVPALAGSTADAVARTIASKLAGPVTVENRAANVEAADTVAKSRPDGSTLLLATPALVAYATIQPSLPFAGLKAFAPVGRVAQEPLIVVITSTLPTSSLLELILLAKASPGRINYASAGVGTASHLATELLKSAGTVQLVHSPAKSLNDALNEVIAGRAKVMVAPYATADAAIKAGKVKALAVTGPDRLALLPDVPTVRESGVLDYDFTGWYGVLAPVATPKAVADRLNADLRKAVSSPDVREKLAMLLGVVPSVSTPDEFAAQLKREAATFDKLAREMNVKLE